MIIAYIDLAQLILDAGFSAGQMARDAMAIVACESGRDPDFKKQILDPGNPADKSYDRGICAINSYWHPEVSDACAYDAKCALREMYRITNEGTDFSPFGCFKTGYYRNHLEAATVALDGAARERTYKKLVAARDAAILRLQADLLEANDDVENLEAKIQKAIADLS